MSRIGIWRQRMRWAARIALVSLVAACGGGGGGGGDNGNDIAVGLTTAGNATTVQAGGTLLIRANVVNTTSNMDVTWSLTGPNCPANCGTITSTGIDVATYTAPASVSASFQVMVTATSIENAAKSGSVQLTVNPKVCPANSSLLSGAYAIHLQGFDRDSSKGMAAIGTISADACGSITDGMVDSGSMVPITTAAVIGTYSVGADRHGTLTLTVSGVSKTFAISLGHLANGVAQRGGLLETAPAGADNSMLVGTLWAQDKSAFAQGQLAGNYAYLLNGWTADARPGHLNERLAIAGTATLDGAGNFSSGLQDRATYNVTQITTGSAWSASTPTFSTATGRAVLTSSAFGALGTAVVYVVSSAQQLVLITNANGAVLSGQLVRQSGTFTQASLSGTLVTNQTQNHWGYDYMNRSILSVMTADGVGPTGTLAVTMSDDNSGGNILRDASTGPQFDYQVAANGQVSIYATGSTQLAGKYYLTRANAGFLLGLDPSVPIGEVRPRSSGPFAVTGNYFTTQLPGSTFYATNSIGIGSSGGTGTLATTMDTNTEGEVLTKTDYIGGALTDLGNGRFTDAFGNVIYAVAPTVFLVMSVSANDYYPVVHLFEQ